MAAAAIPQWRRLTDHVVSVPERIYEHWNNVGGWDNHTPFGVEYGWDGVPWCMEFDWDMFHDTGLDLLVPKTASVSAMAAWAKAHGCWSDYPSVGALVVFGGGAHTEICIGFDAQKVYTKGGNSIQAGASDNGQGNGVWSHEHDRRDPYVTGYLAPKFADGCPPTADPKDPRGGTAVASWRWSPLVTPVTGPVSSPIPPSAPKMPPFPGRKYFLLGASNIYALELQTWLQRGGWGPAYKVGPSRTMTQLDLQKVAALQQHYLRDLGPADGLCGPRTWQYAFETAYGLRKR